MSVELETAESLYPFVLTEEQEQLRREIREFAAREIAPNVVCAAFKPSLKSLSLNVDITSIDHALTQPWTATKTYRRDPKNKEPNWHSAVCAADNSLVRIGEDAFFMSPDGYIMPIKKNQAPPDLRYFKQPGK